MTNEDAVLDLRGLACPQPVLKVRSALQASGGSTVRALVDSAAARDNVCRAAGTVGWTVSVTETEDGFLLVLARA
jgi:TusA-related sulfurtransferase